MPTTVQPRFNRARLAPPGALPISTTTSPDFNGASDHNNASCIFKYAREGASEGSIMSIFPPGNGE